MFRDGTIPSFGNVDLGAEMLPPPSRCESRGQSDNMFATRQGVNPTFVKKNRTDTEIGNTSKLEIPRLDTMLSRMSSQSVSPPSNINGIQRNGRISTEDNLQGSSPINPFDGMTIANQLQQMYRQQLAAASQILVANKMAANSSMSSSEGSSNLASAAFTAAAMTNLLSLDPSFKAFINDKEDIDEKFADADGADAESQDTDSLSGEDAKAEDEMNGGISSSITKIDKNEAKRNPVQSNIREDDNLSDRRNTKTHQDNNEIDTIKISGQNSPLPIEGSLQIDLGRNDLPSRDENYRDYEIMSMKTYTEKEKKKDPRILESSDKKKSFVSTKNDNTLEWFTNATSNTDPNSMFMDKTSIEPSHFIPSKSSIPFNTKEGRNIPSPIPETSTSLGSLNKFLMDDDVESEEDSHVDRDDRKRTKNSVNPFNDNGFDSSTSNTFQKVQ